MTEDERRAIEEKVRADLELEHQRRLSRQNEPSPQSELARVESERRERERLEAKAREAFFLEKGYQRYENSRGQVEWLLPDVYEKRVRRRRKGQTKPPLFADASVRAVVFAVLVSLGVGLAISLVLLRS